MKEKDIILKLTYGVFICSIVGFIFPISLGVKDKEVYNYLILASNCFILTTINCILMLKYTYDTFKMKLEIKTVIFKILPYSLISFMLGLIFMLILDEGFNVKICEIQRFVTALYQMFFSVIVSTIMANDAIIRCEGSIKEFKKTHH